MCIENYGGRSSVGRAPDCDSGRRGFESHRPPHFSVIDAIYKCFILIDYWIVFCAKKMKYY